MAIISRVSSGLGNQLFEYAAARRLAEFKQVPLKLDMHWFERWTFRAFGLKHFNISLEAATPAECERFTNQSLRAKAWRFIHRAILPYPLRRYYKEIRKFHYDPKFTQLSDDVYLQGFFQNEDYFKPIESIIRREFTLVTPLDQANLDMAQQIRSANAVGLHIRRGDYLDSRSFNVQPLDYYDAAIKHICERVAQPYFFIFSDDIEWAKAHLKIDCPLIFVDINTEERDYADLYLMSQCKHHIIANSTFSWWGAWLAEHPSQVVCAPNHWRNESHLNAHNIIPERWTKI
jgi:hypothetical protein